MKKLIPLWVFLFIFWVFVGLAQAAEVGLAWDANKEPDLAGYRIYQGNESGKYVKVAEVIKSSTSVKIDVLPEDGRKVFFAATAIDVDGNESGYSNEVSWKVPDSVAPSAPKNFRLGIELTMTESGRLLMKSAAVEVVK